MKTRKQRDILRAQALRMDGKTYTDADAVVLHEFKYWTFRSAAVDLADDIDILLVSLGTKVALRAKIASLKGQLGAALSDLDDRDKQIEQWKASLESQTTVLNLQTERIAALEADQAEAAKGMAQMANVLLCDKCKELLDGLASAAAARESIQDGRRVAEAGAIR